MAGRTAQRGTPRESARGVARAAALQAKEQLADRLAVEKSAVVRQVMGVAEALRATAEQLEGHDQSAFAGYAERAAGIVERVGDVIESRTLSDVITDLERVGRERPLVAGAVAVAVGFAAMRMARSDGARSDGNGAVPKRARRRGGADVARKMQREE